MAIKRPFASRAPLIPDTHPGETLDQAKSSCNVHCTRTGLPTNCERIAASASAPSPPRVVRPYCPECSSQRTTTFSRGVPSAFAMRARRPCDCAEWVQTVTLSLRTSATATKRPIGACRTYGCSYVAEIFLDALARAAVTSAAFPLLCDGAPHSCARSAFVRLSLPGSPDHSVHLVVAATERAALMASHSFGETTATRFFVFMISAVGHCVLSRPPTEIKFEPTMAGRTMRACNIPGRVTSQLQRVLPVTLSGMLGMG